MKTPSFNMGDVLKKAAEKLDNKPVEPLWIETDLVPPITGDKHMSKLYKQKL